MLLIVKTIRNKYTEWVNVELLNGTECGTNRWLETIVREARYYVDRFHTHKV
jgi:hypothetical protein